jgi:hypothetical protein
LVKDETVQQELECYDYPEHSADCEQFENQYYYVQAKFSKLLQQTVSPPRSRSNSNNEGQHNCSGGFNSSHVKLPTITLPTFSGKVCDWQHFRDTFQALTVDNTQLSDIQRYHYLISSLQGEAKSLIENLPVTTENFHVAWQLVTDRYSNKKFIAMTHIGQLCQLPSVSKGNSGNLRLVINHINTHRNAL